MYYTRITWNRNLENESFLRAGIPEDEFSYILNFHLQLYVFPNGNVDILNFIDIYHEDISQRIFFSFDAVTCFNYKQPGYIAKNYIILSKPNINTVEDDLIEKQIIDTGEETISRIKRYTAAYKTR